MRESFSRVVFLVVMSLTLASVGYAAKRRKDVPEAPIPTAIASAKKLFITDGGGRNLALDEFYCDTKLGINSNSWLPVNGRSHCRTAIRGGDKGTHVWSSTNTYTGQTQVYSHQMVDPQLSVNFYDAKTKDLLWSVTDHRRLARLEKNREKETVNSADRLAQSVKDRISLAVSDATQQTSPS